MVQWASGFPAVVVVVDFQSSHIQKKAQGLKQKNPWKNTHSHLNKRASRTALNHTSLCYAQPSQNNL